MSILIKGMKMPKPKLADMATVYYAYILVSPNGHAAIVVDNEDGLDSTEYPLIPVPGHGDLIDRNVLMEKRWDADTRCGYVQVIDVGDVVDAPTIIPEDKEEDT